VVAGAGNERKRTGAGRINRLHTRALSFTRTHIHMR
jgi:hypothetical protein